MQTNAITHSESAVIMRVHDAGYPIDIAEAAVRSVNREDSEERWIDRYTDNGITEALSAAKRITSERTAALPLVATRIEVRTAETGAYKVIHLASKRTAVRVPGAPEYSALPPCEEILAGYLATESGPAVGHYRLTLLVGEGDDREVLDLTIGDWDGSDLVLDYGEDYDLDDLRS